MKELFNKLSNLFSFGKEHRLVNVGEETQKPVEKTGVKGEKPDTIDTSQSPKDREETAKDEGKTVAKASDELISSLKVHKGSAASEVASEMADVNIKVHKGSAAAEDVGADVIVENTQIINPRTPEDMAMKNKVSKAGLVGIINKGAARDARDVFADKSTVVADADTEGFGEIDLTGKGEGVRPENKELWKKAHEAGVAEEEEMVATRGIEKGFVLPGNDETVVADAEYPTMDLSDNEPAAVADAEYPTMDLSDNEPAAVADAEYPTMDLSDNKDKKKDTRQASIPDRKPSK